MASSREASAQSGSSGHPGDSLSIRTQAFFGALVAAATLAVVMLLMVLAVGRQRTGSSHALEERASAVLSPDDDAASVRVGRFFAAHRTLAGGCRELRIDGLVRNTGDRAVASADLRCYFKTDSGEQRYMEVPLIVESRLDEVSDGGPLGPRSARPFGVRFGRFPDDLDPSPLKLEVVNVRFTGGIDSL